MDAICGILGRSDESLLRRMSKPLSHRGSKNSFLLDSGISLCQLSGRPCSVLSNEEGNLHAVSDCKIYNHRELREELLKRGHEFSTESQAEIIVHAFEEFGTEMARHIDGAYAFALWDGRGLFLGRDMFGIKPLFYTLSGNTLLFASEIKSIFQDGSVKREIDRDSLAERYVLGYVLNDSTPFRGVKQVLPGTIASTNGKTIKINALGQDAPRPNRKLKEADLIKRLKLVLEMRMRGISDTTDIIVSGGLDSSVMAALLCKARGGLKTFSISDNPYDADLVHARMLSEHLGTEHHEFILEENEALAEIPMFLWHYEGMDYQGIVFYLLSKRLSGITDNVLCGQGPDEMFAGYDRYKNINLYIHGVCQGLKGLSDFRTRKNIMAFVSGLRTRGLDFFLREECKSQTWNYQDPVVERGSAAFGIEMGMPYLCRDVLNSAFETPAEFKIRNGVEKHILRKLGEGLGVPREICERPKRGAGYFSCPLVMQRFEHASSRLLDDAYVQGHPYSRFFRERSALMCLDLIRHIFIENQARIPRGFSIESLY